MAEEKILQALIDGCISGDRRSQQLVYKMYYGKMKAVCLRYTKDGDNAMDVLQEGFIKVFQNISKYEGSGSFEGWVRRIMVNLSIDNFRKHKSDFVLLGENHSVEEWEEKIEEDEEEDSEYDFNPAQIVEAMQQLSPAYRTVFNLYVFENYTHQDIANALEISVGTSKSNFAKARRNMKKILLKNQGKRV
ncbi:MAG: sigma-70 family RNA polymerase sigma factor [Crocinitomicaceae bacterium]|nr:sigma-70 family RNA polymerase sigma factor [Crocinitomicaceae bacterium]